MLTFAALHNVVQILSNVYNGLNHNENIRSVCISRFQ